MVSKCIVPFISRYGTDVNLATTPVIVGRAGMGNAPPRKQGSVMSESHP